jgi:hypothetical protein
MAIKRMNWKDKFSIGFVSSAEKKFNIKSNVTQD